MILVFWCIGSLNCQWFASKQELEAQGHRWFINTAHTIHAPCVLVVTKVGEDGSMVTEKSYLKAYDQVINSMELPSGFDVVLQLLAPYFWMRISYPPSYKSITRFLELAIYGALSRETLRQQAHAKYHSLMWGLSRNLQKNRLIIRFVILLCKKGSSAK